MFWYWGKSERTVNSELPLKKAGGGGGVEKEKGVPLPQPVSVHGPHSKNADKTES